MHEHNTLSQMQQELRTSELREKLQQDARFWALFSMVKELTMRAELSEEEFLHHFDLRKNHYHDRILRGAEDVAPRRAAELDDRPLDAVPESPGFPPLFP